MRWKYSLIVFLFILALTIYLSEGKKSLIDPDKDARQNAVRDAFVGPAPTASKPYNILDYTKP